MLPSACTLVIDEGMCDIALITMIHKTNSVEIPGKSQSVEDRQIRRLQGAGGFVAAVRPFGV